MAIPRPLLLAILGLSLVASLFVLTRSSASESGSVTAAPTVAPHAPVVTPTHRAAPPASRPPARRPRTQQAPRPSALVSAQNAKLRPVVQALDSGLTVVLFFSQPGSADDMAAQAAVDALKHEGGVTTVRAGLTDIPAYRPLVAGAGVSQVPALVVLKKGSKSRLIEGLIDAATLRQTIADVRG